MEIQIGLAKVGKYAVSDSGDSVEIVERPRGGMSVVIVDGQGHGRSAKRISHQVASKAATMIGDGARDGAVMRSINDFLYAIRDGRVSATVTIMSADLDGKAMVISRNSNSPVIVGHQDGSMCLDSDVNPIGVHKTNKPSISHWPLFPGTVAVGFTDGVIHAGKRSGKTPFSIEKALKLISNRDINPQWLADNLLNYAIDIEAGKPQDDMAVAILTVKDIDKGLGIRYMNVSYPF